MIEFAPNTDFWIQENNSIYDYCSAHQEVFPNFKEEVWEILPEFCRLVRHFAYDSGAIVREIVDSRSPLEIEVLNGLSTEDEKLLLGFFGIPKKAAGRHLNIELGQDPIVRLLGGAYQEQTVYIREFSNGIRFYAAIWPWRTNPDVLTLHFGVFDANGNEYELTRFKQFLHKIPY